jgi:NAD(P)-dependent dehydrogenase (short-subunit alcohol dehydrogenase family)
MSAGVLKGKNAVVTGSSRGIGRGIALSLAEAGASKIGITYQTQKESAEETLEKVRALGSDGFIIQCDVLKPGDIPAAFEQIKSECGSLDMFVSNARSDLGAFYEGLETVPIEKFDAAFEGQSRAFHLGVRESLKLMPDGGRIIAITYAMSARTGSWQPWAAMGSAKAALESLCRYYAVALGKRGITVNAVSPGATDDSVISRLPPEVYNPIKDWLEGGWTPLRRLTKPSDVGNLVAFLCSDKADFITGQTIYVDGGTSVMDPVFPLEIAGVK